MNKFGKYSDEDNKDNEEKDSYPYETDIEKWNRENSTGMSAGICSNCGSKIYQSTYADFCKCGDSDQGY